jgi:hypothetical protein
MVIFHSYVKLPEGTWHQNFGVDACQAVHENNFLVVQTNWVVVFFGLSQVMATTSTKSDKPPTRDFNLSP